MLAGVTFAAFRHTSLAFDTGLDWIGVLLVALETFGVLFVTFAVPAPSEESAPDLDSDPDPGPEEVETGSD